MVGDGELTVPETKGSPCRRWPDPPTPHTPVPLGGGAGASPPAQRPRPPPAQPQEALWGLELQVPWGPRQPQADRSRGSGAVKILI